LSFYLYAKKTTLLYNGIYPAFTAATWSSVMKVGWQMEKLFIVENKTHEKGNIDRIHFLTSAFSD